MLELLKVWGGRASVAAWRSKKQLIWSVCFLGGFFLVYVQFGSSSPSHRRDLGESKHRSLNSIPKHAEPQKDIHNYDKRVSFLENGQHEQNQGQRISEGSHEQMRDANSNFEDNSNQGVAHIESNVIQHNVAAPPQQYPQAVPAEPNFVAHDFGVDNSWNNGPYKYNSFGEPVYGHTNRLNYVPQKRMVHLDMKGAPFKISIFKTLLRWLAQQGATGVLLEYEDMFPFKDKLVSIRAKNHYSVSDIQEIVSICRENKLEIIPLVQTFGHLEFALKTKQYAYLRELPEHPQALCPSRNDSEWFVHQLIDQMMELHKDAKYLHIGCDEVWQMGECELCRMKSRESIFIDHVSAVATYVRRKHKVIPIIWHDMLAHVSDITMKQNNFGSLVEPMVWVYAEDVYRFVPSATWTKFSEVFDHVWTASAFKGAFGEQSTSPNVRRHLDNNLNWLDVMAAESPKFRNGFRGLVLTGWQRFDHFAVLCELFPAAMPSLAVNLVTVSHGYFNSSISNKLYTSLNCMQTPKYQSNINLDEDPFLWDKFSWCFFPGSLVFKVITRLDSAKKDVASYIEHVTQVRAWISEYNRRHNYSTPNRINEDLEEAPSKVHTVTLLLKTAKEALSEWFDEYTVGEWIEQHIWPLLEKLETLQKESESMKLVKTWQVRPLPLLKELEPYGIHGPKNSESSPSQKKETPFDKLDNRIVY